MGIIALVSLQQNKGAADSKAIQLSGKLFKTDSVFNIGAFAALIIIAALYAFFWSLCFGYYKTLQTKNGPGIPGPFLV